MKWLNLMRPAFGKLHAHFSNVVTIRDVNVNGLGVGWGGWAWCIISTADTVRIPSYPHRQLTMRPAFGKLHACSNSVTCVCINYRHVFYVYNILYQLSLSNAKYLQKSPMGTGWESSEMILCTHILPALHTADAETSVHIHHIHNMCVGHSITL